MMDLRLRPLLAYTALVILTGWGMAACGQLPNRTDSNTSPSSATPTPDTLKIGAILPYTGNLAVVGQSMIEVLPLITDQINACGGVNGESLSLVVEDDQSQPNKTAATLTQLIENNQINAAVIGFVSATTPAVVDVAVQNQVPIVSPATTSTSFTERAKQGAFKGYWARTVPSDLYQAKALARLAIERRYKTASTLVANTDDGISFEKAFTTTFEDLGGTVLNQDVPSRYDPKATPPDFYALDAFTPNGGKPDALVTSLDAQNGAALLRAAYEMGLTEGTQIMLNGSVQPQTLLQLVGKGYDGKYLLAGAMGIVPGAGGAGKDALNMLWKSQETNKMGMFVAHTWDAIALLALAAQSAGSNDGTAIQKQLRAVSTPPGIEVTDVCNGLRLLKEGQEINYQGASGKLDLDENGDVVGSYDIWTIDNQGNIEATKQIKFEK